MSQGLGRARLATPSLGGDTGGTVSGVLLYWDSAGLWEAREAIPLSPLLTTLPLASSCLPASQHGPRPRKGRRAEGGCASGLGGGGSL